MDILNDIKKAQRIAISGHVHPDGDCVGASLGLYTFIKREYPKKEVDVWLESIQDVYRFLPNADKIKDPAEISKETTYDLYFSLDCADVERLGLCKDAFLAANKRIVIDHHASNIGFGDDNYIVMHASSTCELIADFITDFDRDTATCLYSGIISDSGVFQYDSTSPKTMRLVADLIETGIDFSWIINTTYYEKTYRQNRILGEVLLRAKLYEDDRVIASVLTQEDLDRFGVTTKDLEGCAEQLRNTKEADVSIFIYQNPQGTYKVSTRASGNVNLAEIAVTFHGGGHQKAAGFTIEGQPWETIEQVIAMIRKQRKELA